LNNTEEVVTYIATHKEFLKVNQPKNDKKKQVLQEHNKTSIKRYKDTIFGDDNVFETLKILAYRPKQNLLTWKGYDINNYSFHTKS